MENAELTVHEEEGDFFKISLSEKETPQAFKRRVEELMLSGLSEGEARHNAATTPVAMELFYDCGRGMFAIESEPLLHIGIFNPYTGFEIPNENLPAFPRPKESSVSADKIPIVPVPVHLLSILLDYMWQEEKKSWEELVFEQNRTKPDEYDPHAVTGHVFHIMKELSEIRLLDTRFYSQSTHLTRRMLEELPSSLQVREIGNDRMQQIAELAEQFTKIKLHMPPGSHLDMEDQDIAEIWREELIAILHSQDIPQH